MVNFGSVSEFLAPRETEKNCLENSGPFDLFYFHVRKRREFSFASRYISLMKLDPDICYQALLARDARFDGCFFAGVVTAGIYCRPVCPVKTPRRQSCSFFPSAAAAEAAGFRPCLRCRPELAPGNSSVEANARLAHRAASLIEDGVMDGLRLSELAARLGVTTGICGGSFGLNSGLHLSGSLKPIVFFWQSGCLPTQAFQSPTWQ